ncbi:MAG: hypothetical protein HFE66_03820 [Clostridiales bacterium]|jgi:hypothetical protein|nr:hypothetical protein [Clostridiales bacterium]
MAVRRIEDSALQAIAEAIREKTGGTDTMKVEDMPAAIAAIAAGGGLPAKMTVGSFSCPTPHSAMGGFTIEHGLENKPAAVLVWRAEQPNTVVINGFACFTHANTCILYKGVDYTPEELEAQLTDTTFLVPRPSDAGVSVWIGTYNWAAIGF